MPIPPCLFVHIGLPKVASTYIQNVFAATGFIEPFSADKLREVIRQKAILPGLPVSALDKLNFNLIETNKMFCCISDEGLTWSFVNDPPSQHYIEKYQEMCARLVGGRHFSAIGFMMVRNPVDWIRSAHAQSIKEGGSQPLQAFVQQQRRLIQAVLDVRNFLHFWEKYFDKFLILPLEGLKEDEVRFWKAFLNGIRHSELWQKGIEASVKKTNKSNALPYSRLPLLARLNEFINQLDTEFTNLTNYAPEGAEERRRLLHVYRYNSIWVNRRLVEYGTDEQMTRLTRLVGGVATDGFHDLRIPPDLAEHISTHFIEELEERGSIDPVYISQYKEKLKLHSELGT